MSKVSTGKYEARLLTELNALDDGCWDAERLATQFNVSPNTIFADLTLLRKLGFVDVYPIAEEGACELCNKQGKRVTHHWTDELGFHTKRLCYSCNAKLGQIFKGNYPTWEEQVKALNNQLVGAVL